MRFRLALTALASLLAIAPAAAVEPDAPERLLTVDDLLRSTLREEMGRLKTAMPPRDRTALQAFYEARSWRLVWAARKGLTLKGRTVVDEIRKADDYGLQASSFDLAGLPGVDTGDLSDEAIARAELQVAAAVLKYGRDARGGRITPSELSKYLDRSPQLYDPKSILDETAVADDPGTYIRSLHPRHPQFERLRKLYVSLRASGATKAAVPRISDGPRITVGKSHPHVALVRKRLALVKAGGDTGTGLDDTYFDDGLARDVRAFQIAKKVSPADGSISNSTRKALNGIESVSVSPRRILANMEQWRWMPDDLGHQHVFVNIPDFQVRIMKGDQAIFTERIVTGRVDTQTPIFSDEMEFVIFHPEWGVPDSIKVKELWPYLQQSTAILQKQNMRVVYNGRVIDPNAVNWTEVDPRQFSFIQGSGSGNVLGVVKFRFPNKHDVYMHDTPSKHLFQQSVRTFSHGCMRVQNPVRMAEVILAEDKGWPAEKVKSMAAQGAPLNQQVTLSRKLPVHIAYFTVWVGEDGRPHFKSDIYGHEERISLALEGKHHLIQRHREEPTAPLVAGGPGGRRIAGGTYPPPGYPYKSQQGGFASFFSGLFGN